MSHGSRGLNGDFARIRELDGIADEIDQNLRQMACVSPAWRQLGSQLEFERELLVERQRLECAANGLENIFEGIVGQFERELAGLEVGRTLTQLSEQSRILDGDGRLRSEALYQLDLLLAEWANFLPVNPKDPYYLVIFPHRNDEQGPSARELGDRFIWIFGCHIQNVAHLPRVHDVINA
jgi:hypothetical protein